MLRCESGTPFSEAPTLEWLRSEQAAFAVAREWDQFHTPRNLALALVGEVGELVLQGPNVMRGYLELPEATAECLDEAGPAALSYVHHNKLQCVRHCLAGLGAAGHRRWHKKAARLCAE